jgi:hypothetical protein
LRFIREARVDLDKEGDTVASFRPGPIAVSGLDEEGDTTDALTSRGLY